MNTSNTKLVSLSTMTIITSDMDGKTRYIQYDFRGALTIYSDGSFIRSTETPKFNNFPTNNDDDNSVLWKDAKFDQVNDLHLRLYKPSSSSPDKFPIFFYIRGGGFCLGSRTWPNYHNYCMQLSRELQAVVVAPDYRLAPENRLPAAIEDGFAAMKWMQEEARREVNDADKWFVDVADFGRVFVLGDSSGGNIAHHLAVRFMGGSVQLDPVRVRGYILLAPFFGGSVLTTSETLGSKDAYLNLELINRFWQVCVPLGETMDHPAVNPFGPSSPDLQNMDLDPILVVVGGSDLLKDRAEEYAKTLQKWGKIVEYIEFEGQQHSFFSTDHTAPSSAELMSIIRRFADQYSP